MGPNMATPLRSRRLPCILFLQISSPLKLCIVYGRTPPMVLTHWWGYVTWVVPAVLGVICWKCGRFRNWALLGLLFAVSFLSARSLLGAFFISRILKRQ